MRLLPVSLKAAGADAGLTPCHRDPVPRSEGGQQLQGPKGTASDKAVGTTMAAPWVGAVYPPFIHTGALESVARRGNLQSAAKCH